MRLPPRFIIPVFVVLTAIVWAVVPLVDNLTIRWFTRDLEIRANLVATTVEDALQEHLRSGSTPRIRKRFEKVTQGERLFAMG